MLVRCKCATSGAAELQVKTFDVEETGGVS